MPDPAGWPIADRPELRPELRRRLLTLPPRVQVLTGPAGIGKSTLADGVAADLLRARRRVLRVVGVAELRDIPLGAFAPHLAAEDDDLEARLRRLMRVVGGRAGAAVLLVDDGPLLDDVSAAAVYQLVRVFGLAALLTARDGMPWPGPLERLDHEGLVDLTAVPALRHADAADVLRRRLGGRPAPDTVNALMARTEGNPLFLRRLVEAAERTGAVSDTAHGLDVRPPAEAVRIDAAIARAVADLPPGARRLAGMLALAGALPVPPGADADALASSGLAARGAGTTLTLTHPLIAETVRTHLGAESADLARDAAALLETGDDRTALATALRLRLAAGDSVSPERLAAAAADARAAGDHAEAIRLARLAVDGGHPGARPWWDLAASLSTIGRLDEADAAFAAGWERDPDAAERLAGASLHGEHLAYRRHDLAGAVARVDATLPGLPAGLRPLLEAERRIWSTIAGAAPDGPAARAAADAPPEAAVRAAMAAVLSESMRGDRGAARESAAVIDRAVREYGALDPLAAGMMHLQRFFDELGAADGAAAWEVVAAQRLGPVSDAAGMWSYTLGVFCAYDGRLAEGTALAALAVEQLRWRDPTGLLGAAVALRALFATLAGEADLAGSLLDGLLPGQRAEPRAAMLLAECGAWASLSGGDADAACAIVVVAGRGAVDAGYGLVGALTVSLGIRMGRAADVLPVLEAAAGSAEGNVLIGALRDLATAVAGRRVDDGIAAASVVARAGMRATAADALALLGDAARPGEQRRRLGLALDRARRGLDAPLLAAERLGDPSPTERELEVAALVAERLSNQEIAERLGLSPRTVENHLSRFYAKTGLRSRAEARAWVASLGGGRPRA